MQFQICGLNIASQYVPQSFLTFTGQFQEADLVISCAEEAFVSAGMEPAAKHVDFVVYALPTGWLYESYFGEQLRVDSRYSRASLYVPAGERDAEKEVRILLLLRVAIECRLIKRGMLSLHAACVMKNGKAAAFTGKSGTGKSTRARQWISFLGAQWLSGDRPDICAADGYVSGVPWDGKEQIFQNKRVPLHALLDVQRGTFTSVRSLSQMQVRRILMQQCFIPMWDSELAACAMEQIWYLSMHIPGYKLICDRDVLAAQETYNILFQTPEDIEPVGIDFRIKEDFILCQREGRHMVLHTGGGTAIFSGMLALNEVSAFIFEKLQSPVTRGELLGFILSEYEVEERAAAKDLQAVLEKFEAYGILDKHI